MAFADMLATPSKKRRHQDEDGHLRGAEPAGKKSRPTLISSSEQLWQPHDSVTSSPSRFLQREPTKYDSDDQSSMMSEPGSPQDLSADESDSDVAMDSDDDAATFSQSPEDNLPTGPRPQILSRKPWRAGRQLSKANRVPTPIVLPSNRPGISPVQGHVRSRHPQEYIASEKLEVPSPIDEDEVPTPPSAAEAAGSQLELLTVSDVHMQHDGEADNGSLPQVVVPRSERSMQLDGSSDSMLDGDDAYEAMDAIPERMMVRKQRQRSGALSAGNSSPLRGSPAPLGNGDGGVFGGKRGFSMGFRADCEKCRMRVPGHMAHVF